MAQSFSDTWCDDGASRDLWNRPREPRAHVLDDGERLARSEEPYFNEEEDDDVEEDDVADEDDDFDGQGED